MTVKHLKCFTGKPMPKFHGETLLCAKVHGETFADRFHGEILWAFQDATVKHSDATRMTVEYFKCFTGKPMPPLESFTVKYVFRGRLPVKLFLARKTPVLE